jgi:hypothetical protein
MDPITKDTLTNTSKLVLLVPTGAARGGGGRGGGGGGGGTCLKPAAGSMLLLKQCPRQPAQHCSVAPNQPAAPLSPQAT